MKIKYYSNFYEFNTEKFLECLNTGETFKTKYWELTIKRQDKKVSWGQYLSYQVDEEFIKNNKDKLEKLNILSLVKE